jgi:hypothetical protein
MNHEESALQPHSIHKHKATHFGSPTGLTLRRGHPAHWASYSSGKRPLYSSAISSPTTKLGAQQPAKQGVQPGWAQPGAAAADGLLSLLLHGRKKPPATCEPAAAGAVRAAGEGLPALLMLLPCLDRLLEPLLLLMAVPPELFVGVMLPGGPSCRPGSNAAAESAVASPPAVLDAFAAPPEDPDDDCSCCLLSRVPPGLLPPAGPLPAAAGDPPPAAAALPLPLGILSRSCGGMPLLVGLHVTASRSIADALLLLRLCMRLKGPGEDVAGAGCGTGMASADTRTRHLTM